MKNLSLKEAEQQTLFAVKKEIIKNKLPPQMAAIIKDFINGKDVQTIARNYKCTIDEVNLTLSMADAAVSEYLRFCKKSIAYYRMLSGSVNSDCVEDAGIAEKNVVEQFGKICIDLAKPRALTVKRKASIKKAQQVLKKQNLTFEELFKIVQQSDFLCGRIKTGRNWKADFDFVLNENNIMKIIEGKYDNEITCRGGISSKPTYNLGQIKQDALNNTEIKYN